MASEVVRILAAAEALEKENKIAKHILDVAYEAARLGHPNRWFIDYDVTNKSSEYLNNIFSFEKDFCVNRYETKMCDCEERCSDPRECQNKKTRQYVSIKPKIK